MSRPRICSGTACASTAPAKKNCKPGSTTLAPGVTGLNHYLTNERFLDEELRNYWGCHAADNGCQRYADVEAVRIGNLKITSVCSLLLQAWQRY